MSLTNSTAQPKAMPVKHLSARVPWHDNKWNGTFCCNVLDNSFCRILTRIDTLKDPATEPDGELIQENNYPPCIAEKGTFLSPHEYTRELAHSWAHFNPLYQSFKPGIYHHNPFSFNAVPFLWMLKSTGKPGKDGRPTDEHDFPHRSLKAQLYELDYRTELEQEVDVQLGFDTNTWVQHDHNQKVLLDAFFGCLKKKESLIFFYAKHSPLTDPNERVIIGVAKLRNDPGPILHYTFEKGYDGHRSYPWDRCIEHTLTDKNPDGFLMPYHDLIEASQTNELDLREYAAIAPSFEQFSFASELVEHDTAMDSLLAMAEALRKSEIALDKKFTKELAWIDSEISRIWDMRGAYPGMGAILSALKISNANTIAWEIEKYILNKDGDVYHTNPWTVFTDSIVNPTSHLVANGDSLFTRTTQSIWKATPDKKKELIKLLSRIQLTNDQAQTIWSEYKEWIGETGEILSNPYLLYEKTRFFFKGLLSFNQLDKALFPPPKISDAFPLPPSAAMESGLDERRIRAIAVWTLEEAADQGHSLLLIEDVEQRIGAKTFDEALPINEDVLMATAESDFFKPEVHLIEASGNHFLKLDRLAQLKTIINRKIKKEAITERPLEIEHDWLDLINSYPDFKALDPEHANYESELLARQEKAEALRVLINYRVSVLIGPAGSGKTTLLKIFETLPEIKKGGVLKLAPTGKARVKLGHDAQTIAQFLIPERYDPYYGVYWINDKAEKRSTARNVIIDEASMLTEEQLATVIDSLGPIDRLILVGDYRQLPPIGTGRPFVDITNLLRPESFEHAAIKVGPGYAELCQILRQSAGNGEPRIDVQLSRCFGDELQKQDLDLFKEIAMGTLKNPHIRLEKWYESKDFKVLFDRVLREELGLSGDDINKAFNRTLGATDSGDWQYFNTGIAEKEIENWQILSPVNGYGYGVKEVNKFVQQTYRKNFLDLALRRGRKAIAKPKGNDNMVYGDKVINLKNSKWEDWQKIIPQASKQTALNYIANGEVGIITGQFRGRNDANYGEPMINIAFSTQPNYSYAFYPNQFSDDSAKSYKFELAYAITVHKAQGSGFKIVFFVLPSKGSILTRELLYTALTRQEDKIIILHQGEFRDFLRLASPEASATARRFTDLFFFPSIEHLDKKFYDGKYINVSAAGERMISKSEVIIANALRAYKDRIVYSYEQKLKLQDAARIIKPDFTIENIDTGRHFYWEHLGLMTREEYREKWSLKKQGYLADGFVLHTDPNAQKHGKVLIITEENPNGGIDSNHFDEIIRTIILEE